MCRRLLEGGKLAKNFSGLAIFQLASRGSFKRDGEKTDGAVDGSSPFISAARRAASLYFRGVYESRGRRRRTRRVRGKKKADRGWERGKEQGTHINRRFASCSATKSVASASASLERANCTTTGGQTSNSSGSSCDMRRDRGKGERAESLSAALSR